MLVLSRKVHQTIILKLAGTVVSLEVRRITPTRVVIAVEAPEQVKILRGEVEDEDD